MLPTPIKSDLRFSARVDYFETEEDAEVFAAAKRAAGFNVHTRDPGFDAPLHGVHWIDRKGEGFYG